MSSTPAHTFLLAYDGLPLWSIGVQEQEDVAKLQHKQEVLEICLSEQIDVHMWWQDFNWLIQAKKTECLKALIKIMLF